MLKAAILAPLPTIPRAILFLLTLETRQLFTVCSLLLHCYLQSSYKHLTIQYIFIKALTRQGSCSTTHTMAHSPQLKRANGLEKSGSLAFKQEVAEELVTQVPSSIWGMIDTEPEPGTVRPHLHCALGKLSVKGSNAFNNSRPPKQHFAISKQDVKILISFCSFISSGIIIL